MNTVIFPSVSAPSKRSARVLPPLVLLFLLVTLPYSGHLKNVKRSAAAPPYLPVRRTVNNRYEIAPGINHLTIPLKRVGKLLLIDARVDNQAGNLIFDTGAMGLVLNNTYFRSHVSQESHSSGGINGAITNVSSINIDRMDFDALKFSGIKADLTDLGHIENQRGVKILGLLGLSLIRDFEILIDVSHDQMHLIRVDKKGVPIGDGDKPFQGDCTQTLQTSKNVIFLKGTIKGKRLNFCLDSGSETNVISTWTSKEVLNSITITRRSRLQGSGTRNSEVFYGTMNNFEFGNHEFGQMETIITNLNGLSESYGVQMDGVLGFEFLSKGIVCINFPKGELSMRFLKTENK